jgi:hypothetical protein
VARLTDAAKEFDVELDDRESKEWLLSSRFRKDTLDGARRDLGTECAIVVRLVNGHAVALLMPDSDGPAIP